VGGVTLIPARQVEDLVDRARPDHPARDPAAERIAREMRAGMGL
jgi:hypothetical protein